MVQLGTRADQARLGQDADPPPADTTWYLRDVDLFRGFAQADIEELARFVDCRTFRAGDLIVRPGARAERVYVVFGGVVRLFQRGPDGREVTADVVGRGRLFGVSALFGPAGSGMCADAATDAVVGFVDGHDLLRVVARSPQVALNVVRQLGAQLVETEQHLDRLSVGAARARLAGTLQRLAHDDGEEVPGGGRRIREALTHAALARQIGVSRETVTRLLAALEGEGHVRREGRRLVVTNPSRLAAAFGLNE